MVLDGCDIAVLAAAGSAGSTVELGVGVAESDCFAIAPLVTVAQSASAAIRIAAEEVLHSTPSFLWKISHSLSDGIWCGMGTQAEDSSHREISTGPDRDCRGRIS